MSKCFEKEYEKIRKIAKEAPRHTLNSLRKHAESVAVQGKDGKAKTYWKIG